MPEKATTPRRRPTEEIRALILAAAREQFVANGYEATRTKDIARHAGVQERLLYTNFGSKRELFEAALIEPLGEVITEYLGVKHAAGVPVEERLRVLIEGLYDIARENRKVLLSVMGAVANGDGEGLGRELFDEIARTLHRTLEPVSDYPDVDSTAAMIDLAGMIFGVALLDDMLIPTGTRRPSRARLLEEMDKMAAYRLLYHAREAPRRARSTTEHEEA